MIPNTTEEKHLLWTLYDTVQQACYQKPSKESENPDFDLFSGFIRSYATAMRLLERYGMLDTLDPDKGTETPEWTRCVLGRIVRPEEVVQNWDAERLGTAK